ncbi:thioredoxin domain-containing protein [Candidatus Woesearchaeota archaeon]|nr:thioredoxin domain-containing protein [Candidatus Woesearchaeota archaeon]
MICLLALIVFGFLGIFSLKYRVIALEALDCVFRRVTLRKCDTGLDQRLKSQITGNLMRRNPGVGRFMFKHFEVISWFFTILLVLSLAQSGLGIYNFVAYGNCNGKGSDEFCIFDPLSTRNNQDSSTQLLTQCTVEGVEANPENLIKPEIGASARFGNKDAKVTIIEFGCYTCPYTKQAEGVYEKIRNDFGDETLFIYKNYPINTHNNSYQAAIAAECVRIDKPSEFWAYHKALLENEGELTNNTIISLVEQTTSVDIDSFNLCFSEGHTENLVKKDIRAGEKSFIYGTPTLFINDEALVGPKTYREIKKIIELELKK